MPSLADIPVELLLDNLLPLVPVPDLLSLLSTNKYIASLGQDDTFWKRKLEQDFNFDTAASARTTGWKFIYQGLRKPHVYVWGEAANDRLGLPVIPKSGLRPGVPMPTELRIPGVRVVSIAAGGMSFHALDSEGNVHAWGTLDSITYRSIRRGYASPAESASQPLRLLLPKPIRSISTGRTHAALLDSEQHVWNILSWARPFRLVAPVLEADPPSQIECGWSYTSALTASGKVFVWWPAHETIQERVVAKNDELDTNAEGKEQVEGGVLQCRTWDLDYSPFRLPALPSLPELAGTGLPTSDDAIVLVKVAAADNNLVGLTNKGHVLVFNKLDNATSAQGGQWIYLPKFSSKEAISVLPEFASDPPSTVHITHISANFQTFFAHSTTSDIVLVGDFSGDSAIITPEPYSSPPTDSSYTPTIIPSLQRKSVISVSVGDYHNAALTSTGKLFTWGGYSKGALGLGDPVKLEPGRPGAFQDETRRGAPLGTEKPEEVRFDHHIKGGKKRERFCFAATAAGWHTGALVIDLEDGEDDEEIVEEHQGGIQPIHGGILPRPLPRGPFVNQGPGGPILPTRDDNADDIPPMGTGMRRGGLGHFRVGFAGRGLNRGGPHIGGRNWMHGGSIPDPNAADS